jgi:hypothetical protein
MEGYMYEKRKLTLSIRRDVLEEVKKYAINEGKTLIYLHLMRIMSMLSSIKNLFFYYIKKHEQHKSS